MLHDAPSSIETRVRKRRQRRRRSSRRRFFTVSLCGAAFLIAGFIVLMQRLHDDRPERVSIVPTDSLTSAVANDDQVVTAVSSAPSSDRPIYRHSVIPGGAYTGRELRDAIRADAVVAAHYTGVSVQNMRVRRVTAPRSVYVSYRLGDRIYWTSKPVALNVGELILDDGVNEIRARCGNRIAITPPPAVTVARDEPTPELDQVQPTLPSATVSVPDGSVVGGGPPIVPESSRDTPMARHYPLGVFPGTAAGVPMAPRDTQPDGGVAPPGGSKASVDADNATPPRGETPSSGPDPSASLPQPNDRGSNPEDSGLNTPSNPNDPGDSFEPGVPGGRLPTDPRTPVPVPEPATILIVGAGLLATAARQLWSRRG